jgi:CelD/BcsL family acetyltransferase involved in cellulose biosynthesis
LITPPSPAAVSQPFDSAQAFDGSQIAYCDPREQSHVVGTNTVIEWIRDPAKLESIATQWAALEASVGGRTHLSSVDFIVPWYQQYAGPYGGLPLVGLARRDARLIGVAPLTICRGSMGRIPVTRVEFAPSDTPAGEFLVEDDHPETVAAFIDGLLQAATFDLISLDGFAPRGAQLRAVERAAAKHHMSVETVDHAYAVADLSDGYAAYRGRLSSHFRRNLSQKSRKIADAGGAAISGIQFTADASEMDRCVARVIAITEASYKLNGQRLADHHRAFFMDVVRRLGTRGTLCLPILSIGGQGAAFILGVVERGTFYDISLAYAESFAKLSPGSFLMQHLLEQLASAGVHTVVSHGAHEYKKHWATAFVPQKRIFLFRRGLRSTAVRLIRFSLAPVWRRFGHLEEDVWKQ